MRQYCRYCGSLTVHNVPWCGKREELISEAAKPLVTTEHLVPADGTLDITLSAGKNGVVYFEISEAVIKSDRGFVYGRTE